MSPEHLHILQHSLGADQYGRQPRGYRPNADDDFGCYRNRFVTDPKNADGQQCQHLVEMGFMHDHGPQSIAGGMHCYTITQAGYNAMRAASPPPPKLTRAQRTYRAYREVADLFPEGFAQFLRCRDLKKIIADYGHA